mgnify:CR=1 FL=1
MLDTEILSVLYDVTGYEKPNVITQDLRGINSAIVQESLVECTQIGNYYCIKDLGTNYEKLDCRYDDINTDYCMLGRGTKSEEDYWAGAMKYCQNKGLRLPTTNGVLGDDIETSLANIGRIASQGMVETDDQILAIMLGKPNHKK